MPEFNRPPAIRNNTDIKLRLFRFLLSSGIHGCGTDSRDKLSSLSMMQRFFQFLRRLPTWAIVVLTFALLAVVGYTDAITGPDLTFAHFYLVPVCLITW